MIPLDFLIGTLLTALRQTKEMSLKVESRERRDPNTCFSSAVARPTALGMILAVFSLLTLRTERIGIWSCNYREGKKLRFSTILIFCFKWSTYVLTIPCQLSIRSEETVFYPLFKRSHYGEPNAPGQGERTFHVPNLSTAALQLPRRFDPSKIWLSSKCLTSVITRELVCPAWLEPHVLCRLSTLAGIQILNEITV